MKPVLIAALLAVSGFAVGVSINRHNVSEERRIMFYCGGMWALDTVGFFTQNQMKQWPECPEVIRFVVKG